MISANKYIVELDGRAVYASRDYERARKVAWRVIYANPRKEVIVHFYGFMCGI